MPSRNSARASSRPMGREATRSWLLLWVSALIPLATSACLPLYESAHPLGPRASRVQIVPAGQQMSVELNERCRRVGRIEPVMSEHFAKLRADEAGANVAQVLTAASVNGRVQRLDVRFFACPHDISKLQTDR